MHKEQIVRLTNVVCTAENLVSTGAAPEIYIANTTHYYYYYYYYYYHYYYHHHHHFLIYARYLHTYSRDKTSP